MNKLIKPRKNIEAAVQRELVKWIRQEYPSIEVRYNKNENKRDQLQAIIDQKMGQAIAGTPDLTLFYDLGGLTYLLELELKKKDGTLNAAQKIWHSNFKETKNRKAVVAYGYLEAQRMIKEWLLGLPI